MIHIKALGLEVRHLLGSGSFAQVFECYDHRQNKEYAVKMIKKQSMNKSRVRAFFKEAQILETMDHKNIVKFYSFHQTDQYLLIKMELIRGGTLKKLIEKRNAQHNRFKEEEVALFMKNLLEGIRYLHNLNIIHRDLKTGKYLNYKIENILFTDDNDLSSVKIVDFGLSAKLQIFTYKNVKAQCGTLLYMAPQIFNKPSYSKSVDLWSCAIIMYMMFHEGNHPFYHSGMKTDQFKHKLKASNFPALSHQLAQNFIEKISKKEYEERYNVNQALKHPWITRNKDDQIPLSIHQSYKGFDSTHQIITVLKLFLTIGAVVPHKRVQIDQFYKFKVNDFVNNNEAVRVYSPSRRKMRDKNNELFVKMKQIFDIQGPSKPISEDFSQRDEEHSPTIKKHDSVFSRLFERDKTFDNKKQLKKSQLPQTSKLVEQPFEDFIYQLNISDRSSSPTPYMKWEDRPSSRTTFIDGQFQKRLEQQIQQYFLSQFRSVSYVKLNHRNDQRRCIFSKKPDFQDKELLRQKKPIKLLKKFSDTYEIERAQTISRNNYSVPVSTRQQIYNRKPSSPLRNASIRPMSFSMTSRNYQSYLPKKFQ